MRKRDDDRLKIAFARGYGAGQRRDGINSHNYRAAATRRAWGVGYNHGRKDDLAARAPLAQEEK